MLCTILYRYLINRRSCGDPGEILSKRSLHEYLADAMSTRCFYESFCGKLLRGSCLKILWAQLQKQQVLMTILWASLRGPGKWGLLTSTACARSQRSPPGPNSNSGSECSPPTATASARSQRSPPNPDSKLRIRVLPAGPQLQALDRSVPLRTSTASSGSESSPPDLNHKESPKICQTECQKRISEKISDRMPEENVR